jgi:hypothetical protein
MVYIGWATHALQEGKTTGGLTEMCSKPPKIPMFRLWAATRPHEGEIVSNRKSECYGEA